MSQQQYIKSGRRYIPVGYSDGNWTPCAGVWLVQDKPGCKSSECILKIGELPSLYPYANLALDKAELAAVIGKQRELPDNSNAALAESVLKWISTKQNK